MTLLRRWIGRSGHDDQAGAPDGPAVIRAFLRHLARLDGVARAPAGPEKPR